MGVKVLYAIFVISILGGAFLLPAHERGDENLTFVIEGPLENARIVIFKAERKLFLYSDNSLVRKYRIGLGFNPVPDKIRQGDGATPEGVYFVCVKNPQSKYYLSLGMNYPNSNDADLGLASGLISKNEFRHIVQAEEQGAKPPWNTQLGGEIFIHGHGSGSDWTLGCVALDNENMKELYQAVSIGTRVEVRP